MLNKEMMLKWAEALESGEYEQTRGDWGQTTTGSAVLKEGKFCCLNVALIVATGRDIGLCTNGSRKTIYDTYGISMFQPDYMDDFTRKSIRPDFDSFVDMNDNKGMTFPEIAAQIRKMVEAN
jgi:hypothetical protein